MRFIGDVHGKFIPYKKIIADCPASVQVGDMRVGFLQWPHGEPLANPPYGAMTRGNHRFIRGNHDSPHACKNHSQWISDGTIENGMMFVGGADSIDKHLRIEGYSWWPDEELSIGDLYHIVDVYQETKPHIVVTHDAPQEIAQIICAKTSGAMLNPTRTRQALQSMLSCHSPELWLFGHWHHSFDQIANGTRFICLAELEWKDIDLESVLQDGGPQSDRGEKQS